MEGCHRNQDKVLEELMAEFSRPQIWKLVKLFYKEEIYKKIKNDKNEKKKVNASKVIWTIKNIYKERKKKGVVSKYENKRRIEENI